MTSPGEGVSVFTYPYLSGRANAWGEAKGLIKYNYQILFSYLDFSIVSFFTDDTMHKVYEYQGKFNLFYQIHQIL